MKDIGILFTSAGRRVELINSWRKAANVLLGSFEIITVDFKPSLSSACYLADKNFRVPKSSSDGFIKTILDICLENNVKLVIPTIDSDLISLAKNFKIFEKENINLIVSNEKFISFCQDKSNTKKLFSQFGINSPQIYKSNNIDFPCFLKPKSGSSSKGIKKILCQNEISEADLANKDNLFQKLVPCNWIEYSADMYFDKNSLLSECIPRERIETRGGEISKGITRKNQVYDFLKEKFKFVEGARGPITIQIFSNPEHNKFLGIEINPRFGGGYPMSHLAGANFPELIIKEYIFKETLKYNDKWIKDKLFLRHDLTIMAEEFLKDEN